MHGLLFLTAKYLITGYPDAKINPSGTDFIKIFDSKDTGFMSAKINICDAM